MCLLNVTARPILVAPVLFLLVTLITRLPAAEQTGSRAIVPAFERFFHDDQSDAAHGGRLLLGELGCAACHKSEASSGILTKRAPILDRVGSRLRPEYLRAYLSDPQKVKPGATMPHMFAGVEAKQKQQQVEALVHYLALSGQLAESAPAGAAVRKGEKLFHEVGCTACHDPRRAGAEKVSTSAPLVGLQAKYSIPGLAGFLQNPLAVRPSGRMPSLSLNADEARSIASYLLKDLKVAANLKYAYYEGTWDKVPDFSKLKPKSTGPATNFDIRVGRSDNFGVRFQGVINLPRDGEYTFHVGSDDGSRILIDGKQVAASDGVHPFQFKSGKAKLTAGRHAVTVDFFEAGGGEELRVEYQGPGIGRQSLESALVSPEPKKDDDRFVPDPELASQGSKLFVSLNCVSCHQMGNKKPEQPLVEIPSLAKVNLEQGGCMNFLSKAGVPQYALSARQVSSLAAALVNLKQNGKKSTGEAHIDHTLLTFNCYACHQRGEKGGVETARNALFLGNQKEMGDEGRIPPLLTGAGAKLKADWLKQVLEQGNKERPYMFTRMPKFGPDNIGHLAAALEMVDLTKTASQTKTEFNDRKLKVAGRHLVGGKALSCIKCHTFSKYKATGVQSISMTSMHRRLRKEWFLEYMLNPQAYRPGTRMPAAWPNGQTFYSKVLDGKTPTQILAVWTFLSDGDKARVPLGLGGAPIELIAENEAVIYRNFIEGAGPRAIGVGYPEQANLAFDANNMQLALLWHGAFIDASRHWRGRGQGFQAPLGDNVLRLAGGVPFAVLTSNEQPWPTAVAKEAGYRFGGYRLDNKRQPTFLYRLGETEIRDFPEPVQRGDDGEDPGLKRTLTVVGGQRSNLWYRAAAAGKIEKLDDGWFAIDGDWKTRVDSSGGQPVIRKSGNRLELLVPVGANGPESKIIQEISW